MASQTTMPVFQKRHYWALVHVFNEAFPGPSGYEERLRLFNVCHHAFREDNTNFNPTRFYIALNLND